MGNKRILTLLLSLFLLVGISEITFCQKPSVASGTLIVGIPTKDGIVVCADKRLHDSQGRNSDQEVKIHRLEDKWIWTAAGTYYISTTDSLITGSPQITWAFGGFSLPSTIASWRLSESLLSLRQTTPLIEIPSVQNNPTIVYPRHLFSDSWGELTRKIKNDLTNYGTRKVYPVTPNPDNLILQVLFLKIEEDGSSSAHLVVATSMLGDVSVNHGPIIKPDLNKASPLILGSGEVYNELKEGKRPEFDRLRENFYVKPFLGEERAKEEVTVNEALAFESTLIKATSERGKEINEQIEVSPDCYCGLLNGNGFKWISADEYPAPLTPKPAVIKQRKRKAVHKRITS